MRQLGVSRLIDLMLVGLMIVGIAGYVSSAETPLAFAISGGPSVPDRGGSQSAPLQGTNQLVVVAFSDTTGAGPFRCPGCDKIYSSADQDANAGNPLPSMQFVVQNARTGEELGRQQAERQPQGRYRAIFQLPGDLQDDVVLTLVAGAAGFELCSNSSASRTISSTDFILGTHEEVYAFWTGCALEEAEPTASPVPPTATPVPPTVTPPPTATPLPQRSIVVEAFVDTAGPGGLECPGCDRIFSSSDQMANATDPLPNMDFILREADTGRLLARQTTTLDTQGRARTRFDVPAGFDQAMIVELASLPGGYQLCPNIGQARTIQPGDFILGTHLEQFSFWTGCDLQEPTPEPSATATAVPRRSPTPTVAAVLSPTPTATTVLTPTSTATALPAGQLDAVVTARGLNVRSGPGVQYQRIGAVGGGTKLILTGRDKTGRWVRGQAPEEGLEGWLAVAFMEVDGDFKALPLLGLEATPTLPLVDTLAAVVTSRGLNVRAGPGVGYERVGAVAGGTELILHGRNESGIWVRGQVLEEDLVGWLSVPYMEVDGDVLTLSVLEPSGELKLTPTVVPPTPTPTEMIIPDKLPDTGALDMPLWGLLAMASAMLLALSHVWRWAHATVSGQRPVGSGGIAIPEGLSKYWFLCLRLRTRSRFLTTLERLKSLLRAILFSGRS